MGLHPAGILDGVNSDDLEWERRVILAKLDELGAKLDALLDGQVAIIVALLLLEERSN